MDHARRPRRRPSANRRQHGHTKGTAALESLESRVLLAGEPIISEFMALNSDGDQDNYGNRSDWIEIYNPGTTPVDLAGWHLTDDKALPTQWTFPAVTVPAGGFLRVWASERGDNNVGFPLHTNFRLGGDGEYLALIQPDGTPTSEFDPYPAQRPNVSYGLPQSGATTPLVLPGQAARAHIPASGPLGNWTARTGFNDTGWISGTTGIGYETQSGYESLIGLDVEAMNGVTNSVLIRIPFTLESASNISALKLRMKYDDGYVAYLNGQPIASRNAPATLAWDSQATGEHVDAQAVVYEDVDVSQYVASLVAGTNILAIHGLNRGPTSSDLIMLPELHATRTGSIGAVYGFMATPTGGATNSALASNLGPIIDNVTHGTTQPTDNDNILVTASVMPSPHPVGTVSLRYRVNYNPEVSVPMFDDGLHGDGAAGDGVWGGVIPASASTPGQMVRYAVVASDNLGQVSRAPTFAEPTNSPEYFGTMIANPGVSSTLPIFYWWTQNSGAAATRGGTRASVFYNGKFYDNVFVRDRGGNTTDGYKFDFNPGYRFQWEAGGRNVDEIDLNYRSGFDETLIRPAMSFRVFKDLGSGSSANFPIRLQLNGAYQRMAYFNEVPDNDYLERQNIPGNGALYRIVSDHPTMTNAGVFEKKTRRDEDFSDLQSFLNGIHQTGQAQINYLLDNVDIASFLNYWAANQIVNDNDDVQKNYFLYRETEGDREWRFLPWDKDLTFGKHFFHPNYDAQDPQTHPFFGDSEHPKTDGPHAYNFLIDALLDIPMVKQMYLRRLRTAMDQLLQPSSTPVNQRYMERLLDEYYAQIAGDPQVLASMPSLAQGIADIKNRYLAPRRTHLFVNHSTNTSYPDFAGIPSSQPANAVINFGVVEYNPASGDQEQEFIELRNPNSYAVDLSGWTISGGIDHVLTPGTVIPANGSIYLSPNLAAFRARTTGPRGGQGLLVMGPYTGDQLSANGETLVLKTTAGTQVATVSFGPNPSPAQRFLRITEVMYHPADAPSGVPNDEEFEFIELKNISTTQSINLAGVKFTQGVDFTFPNMTLAPGAYTLVVKNRAAFESRYGTGLPIGGEYGLDSLENGGGPVQLKDAVGEEILDFSYDDLWYPSTDLGGRSLTMMDPLAHFDSWRLKESWRPSSVVGGSPGAAGPAPDLVAPTVTVTPPTGDLSSANSITITFSEPVTAFDLSDLALSREGQSIALTDEQTLTSADGGRSWVLGNVGPLTAMLGKYTLLVGAGESPQITDLVDNALAAAVSASFTVNTLAGTAAAQRYRLVRDGQTVHVFIDNDTATPTYSFPAANGPVNVSAGGGDDTVVLDGVAVGAIDLGGGSNTLHIAGGSYNFSSDLAAAGGTTLRASGPAQVTLSANQNLSRLDLSDNAVVSLAANGSRFIRANDVVVAGNAELDLYDNAMILPTPNAAARDALLGRVHGLLRTGRHSGSALWTGSGINSSSAAAVASSNVRPARTLAAVANTRADGTPLLSSLFGQNLDANAVLVKYALEGDSNLDGRVDISDFFAIDSGRALRRPGYAAGDLNYTDGHADGDDYMLIDRTFLSQAGPASGGGIAPAALPSPASLLSAPSTGGSLFPASEEDEELEPLF